VLVEHLNGGVQEAERQDVLLSAISPSISLFLACFVRLGSGIARSNRGLTAFSMYCSDVLDGRLPSFLHEIHAQNLTTFARNLRK
jgi:hypothetical protein